MRWASTPKTHDAIGGSAVSRKPCLLLFVTAKERPPRLSGKFVPEKFPAARSHVFAAWRSLS
jgi:hypothetical protein